VLLQTAVGVEVVGAAGAGGALVVGEAEEALPVLEYPVGAIVDFYAVSLDGDGAVPDGVGGDEAGRVVDGGGNDIL